MKTKLIGIIMAISSLGVHPLEANELKISFPIKNIELDPQKIEDMYSTTLVNQIYARLFKYTPDGQIRPDLVEKWSLSKGKDIYIFQLREMKFSDGSTITASHVANSLKRIFIKKAALASDFSFIKGAKKFLESNDHNDIKIYAENSHTLKIETETPSSLLLYLLAVSDVGILKIDSPTKDISFNNTTPFSGPYKIKNVSKDKIEIEKWRESDLDSKNPPNKIVFNLFDKIDINKVINGNFTDTSSFMTFDEEKSPLLKDPEWKIVASEASNERFIVMNPKKIPLKVRQWLLSQVDTDDFVKFIGDKTIAPAYGFIPNCLPGHLKNKHKKTNPTLKLDKFMKLKIQHGDNLPYTNKFKEYLSKVWSHPNIKIEFESLPVEKYLKMLFESKGEILIAARGLEYPEGYSVITYFRSNLDSNFFYVNSKEIDQLIDQASQELNDQKRFEIYKSIQIKVLDYATVVPLAFGSWKKYFWSKRVKDVPAHPIGIHFMPFEMLNMAEK